MVSRLNGKIIANLRLPITIEIEDSVPVALKVRPSDGIGSGYD